MPTPNNDMQAVLDAHAEFGPMPIETLTPEMARLIPLADCAAKAVYGQNFTKRALAPMPLPVGKIEHRLIAEDVMARIYTPTGDTPKTGWPTVLYFHGGGWVIANLDTYDGTCRALCEGAKAIIVSVHYRQAPEHPWPAAVEDAYGSYQWLLKNIRTFGGDSARIAIAGESAGGNLATVATLLAKQARLTMPVYQLLIYPVTDVASGLDSASAKENAIAKPLNRAMLSWFYDHYVPEDADRRDPRISPLYARDLAGLPPTTIILAEIDPLRDDGVAYAKRLRDARVDVQLRCYDGVCHEFFGMVGVVGEANDAMKEAVEDLTHAFEAVSERPRRRA